MHKLQNTTVAEEIILELNVKYGGGDWLMTNSNTYWCKEGFSWKVPPPTQGLWTLITQGWKPKDFDPNATHYVVFKLINLH